MNPGLYDMIRTTDQTGVSGTGRVAQMAIFEDGTATVRWMTGKDSTVNWSKWQDAVDVHINAHPDTTKLVPYGVDPDLICEHGIDVCAEYCDPCAEAAVAAEASKDMKASDRWATLRQTTKRLSEIIYDYCASRQIRCQEHDSHGLYFDAWVRGKKFMLDASPEDMKSAPPGLIVVRDESHHYERPTRVSSVNMFTAEGPAMLDDILGVQPA